MGGIFSQNRMSVESMENNITSHGQHQFSNNKLMTIKLTEGHLGLTRAYQCTENGACKSIFPSAIDRIAQPVRHTDSQRTVMFLTAALHHPPRLRPPRLARQTRNIASWSSPPTRPSILHGSAFQVARSFASSRSADEVMEELQEL